MIFQINEITNPAAKAISESVKHNSTLQNVRMSWNNDYFVDTTSGVIKFLGKHLKDVGAQTISEILFNNLSVTLLDISSNVISHNGAGYISDFIKNNCKIEEIDMSHNNISSDGMQKIAMAVESNCTIKKLTIVYPILRHQLYENVL